MVQSRDKLTKTTKSGPNHKFAQSTPYGKDISEHVSSVGRFYADFDEIDLAEIAPPAGPKQHWWDNDYTPYIEDGHKPKICNLSDLASNQSKFTEQDSPSELNAELNTEMSLDANSDSDLEFQPPVSSFNPLAYRQRQKHQHHRQSQSAENSQDIKSARDLVNQESYQERLRKHLQQKYGQELELVSPSPLTPSQPMAQLQQAQPGQEGQEEHDGQQELPESQEQQQLSIKVISPESAMATNGLGKSDNSSSSSSSSSTESPDLEQAHSTATSHYAQELEFYHHTHQQGRDTSEPTHGNSPQSAKLSYAEIVSLQRAHTQELKEQLSEQRAHDAITPWNPNGDKWLRSKSAMSAKNRLLHRHGGLATQGAKAAFSSAAPIKRARVNQEQTAQTALQGAEPKTISTPDLVGEALPATAQPTAQPKPKATSAQAYQGKVPYRNYFASQNVFGSSSESESDIENKRSTYAGSEQNTRNSRKWGKEGATKRSSFGQGQKSGLGRKKANQVIDYDDISCGVSGIGLPSSNSSSNYADAYDIEESTASFGSFGGGAESNSTRKKGYGKRNTRGAKSRSGYKTYASKATMQASESAAEVETMMQGEHTALASNATLGAGADTLVNSSNSSSSCNSSGEGREGSGAQISAGRAQVDSKAKQSEPVRAYNYMIQLLTRREYSQSEIRQKVKGRFSDEAVEEALQRCVEYGYQSDTRHAEMLVRHMEFSGYGPQKLWLEARRKGADEDEIKRLSAEVDWDDIAYQAVTRKFTAEQVADYATRNKAIAYLARRGFSSSSCFAAISRLQQEAE